MKFSLVFHLSFLSILLFLSSQFFSQAPDTLWTKTFGGVYGDVGHSVQQTTDGGYIISGFTNSIAGNSDLWLIKTDGSGDTLWTKTYGGSNSDWSRSIQQTTDGGYIVAGTTESFGAGLPDFWLIRTDASGDTLWTKTFGGYNFEDCYSIQQTTDGGYILVGETHSFSAGMGDVWVIKTNASGDTLWTKALGGIYWDVGSSVQQTSEGGYIISGTKNSLGGVNGGDVWLIKTDASGDTLWTKTYGGNYEDYGYSVRQTTDGGYIITGYKDAFGMGTNSDVWLIKTDASGDTLWTKTYGGNLHDGGHSVQQTMDGGYIITGIKDSYDGINGSNLWLLKTDSFGDSLWTKTYGGSNTDAGGSVQQTTDGGYILAGFTKSFGAGNEDVWLIKIEPEPPVANISVTSPNGGEVWVMNETKDITWTSENIDDVKLELSIDNGMSWTAIVDSTPNIGTYSWVVSASAPSTECLIRIYDLSDSLVYDESDSIFTIEYTNDVKENDLISEYILLQNFPNPFNPRTSIQYAISSRQFVSLKVFDALGNEIETLVNEEKPAGIYEVTWYVEQLPSGVYFYQLKAGEYVSMKKMILIK